MSQEWNTAAEAFDPQDAVCSAAQEALLDGQDSTRVSFRARLPAARLLGDPVAWRHAVRSLIASAVDFARHGLLHAEVRGSRLPRRMRLSVELRGAGPIAADEDFDGLCRRLGLDMAPGENGGRLRRARGACRATGGRIECSALAGHGFLLRFDAAVPLAESAVTLPATAVQGDRGGF